MQIAKLTTVLWVGKGEGRKAAEFSTSLFPGAAFPCRRPGSCLTPAPGQTNAGAVFSC